MFRYRRRSALFLLVLASACGKSLPTLENVDQIAWKNDKNGCGGMRGSIVEGIMQQKSKLLSLSELEIVSLLGKPDQNELYTRNQKFYYYFVEPAEACDSAKAQHQRLVVRFNAVGLASEILLEE